MKNVTANDLSVDRTGRTLDDLNAALLESGLEHIAAAVWSAVWSLDNYQQLYDQHKGLAARELQDHGKLGHVGVKVDESAARVEMARTCLIQMLGLAKHALKAKGHAQTARKELGELVDAFRTANPDAADCPDGHALADAVEAVLGGAA